MTEAEKRAKRACFTGYRPHKLHGCSEEQTKAMLRTEIQKVYDDGFRTFITCMAMGVDIWAGELVLELRDTHPDVHLICALPHEGFEASWDAQWQARYRSLLEQADLYRVISQERHRGVYQVRNEWMVDRSARVIAVYNGDAGGTRNTIAYAAKKNVTVRQIDV